MRGGGDHVLAAGGKDRKFERPRYQMNIRDYFSQLKGVIDACGFVDSYGLKTVIAAVEKNLREVLTETETRLSFSA